MKCQEKKSQGLIGAGVIVGTLTATITGLFGVVWGKQAPSNQPWSGSRWNAPGLTFLDERATERVVDLRGNWRFATGDQLAWAEPGFEDQSWASVQVPNQWEDEGFKGYDGFAWYRTRFVLPKGSGDRPLYLRLGRIDDADEVFLNGVRIGATGTLPPVYEAAWDAARSYELPQQHLNLDGNNVLAVRVYDGGGEGGIVNGAVAIYASDVPAPLVNLAGWWQLRAADDPGFSSADYVEDGFQPVRVPGHWDRQGLADFDGHAWYRKHFQITSPLPTERLVLMLGLIDDTDEVFLNGILIGRTGTAGSDGDTYRERRAYPFDPDVLRSGNNVLAVRVHDRVFAGGISEGPIGIMTFADHERYQALRLERRRQVWKPVWDWLLGR